MSSTAAVLSAQEQAIASGATLLHGTATDRVVRMYDAIRAYGTVRVTLDRAVLFTESFKATESQPLVLRWAKALKHFVENVPVTIFPDELIVGRPNTWFGKWGIVYPELDGSVMPAGVEMFKKNKGKPGDVTVTEEDDKIISEVLTPYWTGRDFSTNFIKSLPEDTRFVLYGPDPNNLLMQTVVIFASCSMRHSQNWTPDFTKILTRGVKGIREEAQAKLAALSEPRDIVYKKPFLDAVVMTCDAMTTWSRRYAQLARELAAKEADPPAEGGVAGDRRHLRAGSGEPGPHVPGSAPGAVVGPDVQPHRADLVRHGTGPDGSIPVAVLPEGHRRGPDHERIRDGVAALPLAEHGAVRRDQDEPRDGGRRGGVCQVRGRRFSAARRRTARTRPTT